MSKALKVVVQEVPQDVGGCTELVLLGILGVNGYPLIDWIHKLNTPQILNDM